MIGGCPPLAQMNMGPLQDIPHAEIMKPITRTSRTLRVADQLMRELDEAVSRAMGDMGEPGPVYIEIPPDVLRETIQPQLVLDEWMNAKPPRVIQPNPDAVKAAVEAIWSAKRPLVLTGRGAKGAARNWCGCSMPPARSISTLRKAAASSRPTIRPSWARCADRR